MTEEQSRNLNELQKQYIREFTGVENLDELDDHIRQVMREAGLEPPEEESPR